MEDKKRKKKLAAIAAVYHFIRTEEDMINAKLLTQKASQPPDPPLRLWGVSARQAMMQTRNLMQLKAFHAGKLR